ncbi:MAG: GIY-YIG nuclease family protein [Acidimicrobiales bacterium]|nr:GIY-YIG nuclease family protein [Hyphomonadaceae bacterium]RZV41099.1 MAG: GIY-YIG nuclease family protein [Acidimicrobiales bacterium]
MFFTYMVTNQYLGTLYTGHTDDLSRRIDEHRNGALPGFSKKYGCTHLVWFELHETRASAFRRERQIKRWNRAWKIRLIKKLNPKWDDLYPKLSEAFVYDEQRIFNPARL